MPDNPFTVTIRATVTVTDLDALVRQVDELVDLSDELEPLEEDTHWDGWEERDGTGYVSTSDAVWLADDPGDMLCLSVGLCPSRAEGVDVDLDCDVDPRPSPAESTTPRFAVVVRVYDVSVIDPVSASSWLGPLKGLRPPLLAGRTGVALLDSIAGCDVKVTSVIARRDDLAPGRYVGARQAEISLVPPADLDPDRLPPDGERIVVTKGGRHYETDENGYLVTRPPGYPSDRSLRRPVRFDGETARTLVHFMHPIPIGRGFMMAWVTDNVPGWDANGLIHAISGAGLIDSSGSMPKLVAGVKRVDISPSGLCTRVDLYPKRLRARVRASDRD